jgi:CubicO group peptidase (beta-lactamase class C family)
MISKYRMVGITSHLVRLTLIVLVAGLLAAPVHATTHTGPIDPVELEAFLDGVMAAHLESYHIPGAMLAVVGNGELLLAKGYGYADLEQRTPVEPARTLFRPGSTSKLITWTAVMQLVEQGRLDLHADVNGYLDFTIPATFPEPVTLAHLMTHTPGFEDVGEDLFVLSVEEMHALGDYLKQRVPARVFPPGEVGAYSNYGTALAAYIVERVAGESFAEYVENHIFAPLGMQRSTFRQPLPAELADDLAGGYGFHNGLYVRGGFEFVVPYPAGSMSATATDMAAFMIAHMQEGRYADTTILQPATVQEMHRRQYTADPRLHGMAYGFWEQHVNGRRILNHSGDTFLFHSGLYLAPEENVGIFVSYNGSGGGQARDLLLRAFMDRYYPAAPPAPLTPPADAAARIAPYAGEYHLSRANYSTVEKFVRLLMPAQVSATPEGHLLLAFPGRTEPYTEVEAGLFRHSLREELLVIQTRPDGSIWLLLDGEAPFSFFKVPWYATSTLTGLLLLLTLLLFIGSSIGWLTGALRGWRRGTARLWPAWLARWLAALFGLIFLIFLLGFLRVMGDIDPAYGVPRFFFGAPLVLDVILWLPWLLAIAAAGLALFTFMAWLGAGNEGRPYWSLAGRLHYTALAVTALAVMGSLWFWNFLAITG